MTTVQLDRWKLLAGVTLRSRYMGIRNNEHRSHCSGSLRHLRRTCLQSWCLPVVTVRGATGSRPLDWEGRQPGRIPPAHGCQFLLGHSSMGLDDNSKGLLSGVLTQVMASVTTLYSMIPGSWRKLRVFGPLFFAFITRFCSYSSTQGCLSQYLEERWRR